MSEVEYAIFWYKAYGENWREKREEELKKQREETENRSKTLDYKP